jgi:hypothetical protein
MFEPLSMAARFMRQHERPPGHGLLLIGPVRALQPAGAAPPAAAALCIPPRLAGRLGNEAASRALHCSAFAGITPVATATAAAWVRFMQCNLWRAVSR